MEDCCQYMSKNRKYASKKFMNMRKMGREFDRQDGYTVSETMREFGEEWKARGGMKVKMRGCSL